MSDYAGEFVHFVSIVQRRIVFATFRLSGILLMILTLIGSDGCVHKECLCSGSNSVSLCSVCTSHLVPPLTAFVNVSAALLVLAEGELFSASCLQPSPRDGAKLSLRNHVLFVKGSWDSQYTDCSICTMQALYHLSVKG